MSAIFDETVEALNGISCGGVHLKGQSTGGQFALSKNPESTVDLAALSVEEPVRSVNERGNVEYRLSNGQRHRDGGLPAIEGSNGNKEFYVNGQPHRDGGLPAVEWSNGNKEFYVNGQPHRDGGLPAIEESDGSKEFYVNGQRHRTDGPAVSGPGRRNEYWLHGEKVLAKDFAKKSKNLGDSADQPPSK